MARCQDQSAPRFLTAVDRQVLDIGHLLLQSGDHLLVAKRKTIVLKNQEDRGTYARCEVMP